MAEFELSAFIENLNSRTRGMISGAWLSFPTTNQLVQETLRLIGVDGLRNEEMIFTDFRITIPGLQPILGEYAHVDDLNYLAHRIKAMSPEDCAKFVAAVKHGEYADGLQDVINLTYKGICILAPCPTRKYVWQEVKDPKTGATIYNKDGSPKMETRVITITRFKIATVFDVSQTEGRELPSIGATRLTGEVDNFQYYYDKLVELSPVAVTVDQVPRQANGYYSHSEQRIVLRPGLSEIQTIKTLVHEISHALLHDPNGVPPEERKDRNEKEVEAESIAYVVCQHFGIDTSEYSFGYVAGWSNGKELSELKDSLDLIHRTAGEIINALDDPEKGRQQELPIKSQQPTR